MRLPLTYHVCDLPAVSLLFHARLLFQGFWSFSVYVWAHSKRPNSNLHTQGARICETVKSVLLSYVVKHTFLRPVLWLEVDIL